jgi:hypothetical protein
MRLGGHYQFEIERTNTALKFLRTGSALRAGRIAWRRGIAD